MKDCFYYDIITCQSYSIYYSLRDGGQFYVFVIKTAQNIHFVLMVYYGLHHKKKKNIFDIFYLNSKD